MRFAVFYCYNQQNRDGFSLEFIFAIKGVLWYNIILERFLKMYPHGGISAARFNEEDFYD